MAAKKNEVVEALPLPSSTQHPWSVPYEIIRNLTDTALTDVMRRLLCAEAALQHADLSQVSVNSEEKAGDDGCDGWTPRPPASSNWLGARETCWQFKAGTAGQPAKLAGEVAKDRPTTTLKAGGRFVVVTSASVNGDAGRSDRRAVLVREATELGLPVTGIDVFTSETLSTWLEEHPAISWAMRGLPSVYWGLPAWNNDPRHREGWFPTPTLRTSMESVQKALSSGGGVSHVHIWGRPGVGKSRFAREVCASATWATSVLYVPQPSEDTVHQIIAAATQSRASLVLVVDEAAPERLSNWGAAAHHSNGRVRLLTIGHTRAPDPTHLAEVHIEPMDRAGMLEIVRDWHPEMPPEQHEFIADFTDGYVRLAKLAGNAVSKDPSLNACDLLKRHEISILMTAMLGSSAERRKLHVVAALSSVGWDGQRAEEGAAIAKHLGLDWNEVRAAVQDFDSRLGIAPRAGDLRYISPVPLGIYLALEAWETYPDKMMSLADALPSDASRLAYAERLQAVLSAPSAKEFAQEQLSRFFSWEKFVGESDVERWAVISSADPVVASQQVRRALERATRDERLQIKEKARRNLVNALTELAWGSSTFVDAALSLAALADAENEIWANNATGEFLNRYQIFLGGTAASYDIRMAAIDALLGREEDSYWILAVSALSQVGRTHASRSGPTSRIDVAREPEWQPTSRPEHLSAIIAALKRLTRIAQAGRPGIVSTLQKAIAQLRSLLHARETREHVADLMRALSGTYPELKRELRQDLRQMIELEQKHRRRLAPEDIEWLKTLFVEFEDNSPEGRLRDLVALRDYEFDATRLDPVAVDLQSVPGLLEGQWPWLTSGDAIHAWQLGAALSKHDLQLSMLPRLVAISPRGPDVRFIAGYLCEAAVRSGEDWLDDLLDQWLDRTPLALPLVAELSWRCSPTDRSAARIARHASDGALPASLAGQLVFGGWCLRLSAAAFASLLRTLVSRREYREAAVSLAHQRLSKMRDEWTALESVVLALLGDTRLLRRADMTEFAWLELAKELVPGHAGTLAEILFAAHAKGDAGSNDQDAGQSRSWFLEHSQAAGILSMCVETNPSEVWAKLRPYLEDQSSALMFTIGFPGAILSRLPHDAILEWIKQSPEYRALFVARLTGKNLAGC